MIASWSAISALSPDERNEQILRALPDAAQYRFHRLLSLEELLRSKEIRLRDLLDKAVRQLEAFEGPVDAIIGFWDFPVSTIVPIMCHRLGDCAARAWRRW